MSEIELMQPPPGNAWDHDPHHGKTPHAVRNECLEIKPYCEPYEHPVAAPPGPEGDQSPRASALNEARDLITGDRNAQYGPPTQDFKRTAELLNALGYRRLDAVGSATDITMSDVAIIVAQVKVSRLMHSRGKRDSWVDLAGYAACGYECAVEEEKEATA